MFARAYGATTMGVEGIIINVEIDCSPGLPCFDMVGLPDAAVKEAKERVRTGIKNSGIKLNAEKVTVNLAPAAIRKDSAGLDLPIAVALLKAYKVLQGDEMEKYVFAAELSLAGECRSISGVLPMAIKAKEAGFEGIFVSPANVNEALLVDDLKVYSVANVAELVEYLSGRKELRPAEKTDEVHLEEVEEDFADVQGQFLAKRAFEIAAAGGHNLLMVGSPGAGKTMLARRMSSILPQMEPKEALEVTKIYSIAGMLKNNSGLITVRPFRAPHHTISSSAMVGGGVIPRPGEVTLSHNGVLFLDELPEFSKQSLEVLRQPIEDGSLTISRVNASLTYPSRFMLIAALNPCPCGFYGDKEKHCNCSFTEIKRYTRRISGPLLDRIDIHLQVPRVTYKELNESRKEESSAEIRKRVEKARKRQLSRFREKNIVCNAQMSHAVLKEMCRITKPAQNMMERAFKEQGMSARSYDRIIKVAQTIADLDKSDIIDVKHMAEAIQFRSNILKLAD